LTFYSFLCNLEATPSSFDNVPGSVVADLEPETIVASLKEYPWRAPTPPPSESLEGDEDEESEGSHSSGGGMTDDKDMGHHKDEMEAGEAASNREGEGAIHGSLLEALNTHQNCSNDREHVLKDIESWRSSVYNM
jgi:hypothetical protein